MFRSPDEPSGPFLDPTFGWWGTLAQGGVAVHAIPGDHLSIFDEAGAGIMAGHLNQALDGKVFQGGTLDCGLAWPGRPCKPAGPKPASQDFAGEG